MSVINRAVNKAYHKYYLQSNTLFHQIREMAVHSTRYHRYRDCRLQSIISHAQKHIPYYRGALTVGVTSQKGNKFITDCLQDLPILTKEIIRAVGSDLQISNHEARGSYINTSGGSTGEPIPVVQDREFAQWSSATFLFVKSMRMVDPYTHTAVLWGAHRDLYGSNNTIIGSIKNYVNNSVTFNSAKLEPQDIEEFIRYINNSRPKMIVGYAQSLEQVAKYAITHSLEINSVLAIHSGAGKLYNFMRENIAQAFRSPIYDHYGGREFSSIATECSAHDGLHIMGHNRIVEIVDQNGKACSIGQEGRILVTTLDNYSMPLIRYDTGDIGVWAEENKCSCGIVYPKLGKVTGRTSNNFILKSGGFVSGEYLTLTFNHVVGVINFQIRQIDIESIKVYLVVTADYQQSKEEAAVTSKLRKLFGEAIKLQFEYVKSIPKTSTGKHLFTVCEI